MKYSFFLYINNKDAVTTCPCPGNISLYFVKDFIKTSAEEIVGLKRTMATK